MKCGFTGRGLEKMKWCFIPKQTTKSLYGLPPVDGFWSRTDFAMAFSRWTDFESKLICNSQLTVDGLWSMNIVEGEV